MNAVVSATEALPSLEQRRFEALEPLLLEEERALWLTSTEAAASFFGCHSAALVMLSSGQQHVLLGQFGMDAEFEISRAIAAEISPANVAMILESSTYLANEEAKQWGLSCWLRASRSQGLAVAPLWMGDLLVGALVVGVPGDQSPRNWKPEHLDRFAQEISALLNHNSAERLRERNSGLTVVDPGAARMALRGALRRIEQLMLQLTLLSSQLWRGLALHSEEEIMTYGPSMSKLYLEALNSHENLARRLKMLVDWSSPEGSEQAQRRVLALAQGLLGLRSMLLLAQAISRGRLSSEQGSIALRMLGNQGPDGVRMVQVTRDLQDWLEGIPSSIRPRACSGV